LEPGDTVLFFRDGISYAFSVEGESFGIERLQAACESQLGASPVGLLREVFAAVNALHKARTSTTTWQPRCSPTATVDATRRDLLPSK
jgi:serine phosphatase RsbU (regulator of sigma subunit)